MRGSRPWHTGCRTQPRSAWASPPSRSVRVAAQKRVALEQKLGRLAELSDRTKELRTRHDMTARANAKQRVRLQATYGGEELLESREALEVILADLGDPEADQAELRQLTRELDVRGAPCFAVCRDVPGDAQCSASPGL
jgi:hypothetical protein